MSNQIEIPSVQHAPGPWSVGGEYSNYHDEIECGDGRTVAVVWTRRPGGRDQSARSCFRDDAEGKANARLIAAAPDLLTQLQRAVETLEYWFPRWGDPEGANSAQMQAARAAIAKATGAAL